jgi:hypothetical protein
MLTKEQVLIAIQNGLKPFTSDRRDFHRLVEFFPLEQHAIFKVKWSIKEPFQIKEWTKETILQELKDDLEFAFEKAVDKRGISACEMYGVIKMWTWILEDSVDIDCIDYGLPFFRAVATKYNLPTEPEVDSD